MTATVVDVRGARLGHTGRTVLDGVTFSVDRGELVGLLGVSGAGKSTLLAALGGSDVVHGGDVLVGGNDPRNDARPVGLVPQLGEEGWGPLCVEEIVALGRPRRGLATRRSERSAVAALLDALNLAGLAHRRMHELSGGQRQRVAIARALHASPELLLCDEPTSGADPALAGEIVDLLRQVAAAGTAVLVATHDLGVVVPRLDRVLGLGGGHLVVDAVVGDLDDEMLRRIYGPAMRGTR